MLISYFHVSVVECSVYVLVFRTSTNFLCSRCLAGKIVVVHIISMRNIYHNFLCNRLLDCLVSWLSFLIVKTYFPYYVSFLTLGQRFCCHQLHLSISSYHPC